MMSHLPLPEYKPEQRNILYYPCTNMRICYIPTVQIGLLRGTKPIILGRMPLPKNNGGAKESSFINLFWKALSLDPLGLLTWLKISFSPKEKTGTRYALHRRQKENTLYVNN